MKKLTLKIFMFACLFAVHAQAETKLTVAAFNTWGVPLAVWDTWRYGEAMQHLEKMSPDLIVLEEVFTKKGKNGYASYDYPYVAHGPGALPRLTGSGLKILSKYPIERIATLVYRSCLKDDCLSRKGALLTLIELPDGQRLNLVATHLNARGDDTTRIDQLNQLRDFIAYYAEHDTPVLIVGDFNFNPSSGAYQYLMEQLKQVTPAPISDLWATTHDASDPGYTNDSINNTYAHDYNVRTNFPLTQERIDYQLTTQLGNSKRLVPISSKLFFNEKPFYSDHYGVWGEYAIQ
jgi:endonuclease/exonuclease/phosphatase family metal-dependent hydrolase